MCGRFTIIAPYEYVIYRFAIKRSAPKFEFRQSYNVAPGQKIMAVVSDGSQNRLGDLKWGLIPPWAKDPKIGYKLINARAESVADKPSFQKAFRKHRCLIIADSFYEWTHDNPKNKRPFRFKLKSGDLFAMAGLWEAWRSPEGGVTHSAAIITTDANALMAPIHNRMPVILRKEDEQKWIDPSVQQSEQLSLFLKPYASKEMEAYEVSRDVNSPRHDDAHLIDRI
ncbi:SOS response-associated peptidase [Sporolactobacillus vineae]|uniref:SOS response-associated peptidase n=1 Tax=Sporolactobacillus vineae TaxID=444463 RepID=UPI0002885A0B|nr:SOS response-associated peptidase [Sporolactobacillus vineae]